MTTQSVAATATAVPSIAGIPVRSTRDLISPDTKICMMVWAPAKRGKTTFAASLDTLTRKHFDKRTLFIALEPSDGGGTMSIESVDPPVDFVAPATYEDYNKIIAWLMSDTTYGGVVMDSSYEYVGRFLKPYALKFPYTKGAPDPTRAAGVPGQSDYQTMGEQMRSDFNKLINLTTHPDLKIRKHLIVTALEKEKYTREKEPQLISMGPDLPGAMATVATSMFQTVAGIDYKTSVVPDPTDPKKTIRQVSRILATDASLTENQKRILGDRTKCIPQGAPLDLCQIWEQYWMPRWTNK